MSGCVVLFVLQCLIYPVGGDGEFEEAAAYGVGHSVSDGCGGGVVGKLADGFRLLRAGAPSGLDQHGLQGRNVGHRG